METVSYTHLDVYKRQSGEWKFQYYNSIYDVKESFYEKGYDVSGFDHVTVPGVWQMDGYDTHQYTNIRYPFPFDPPYAVSYTHLLAEMRRM